MCRVIAPDGGRPMTETDLRDAAGLVDLELDRLGFERREVIPFPDGRIRIVLPDADLARMDEVRALIANPRLRLRAE